MIVYRRTDIVMEKRTNGDIITDKPWCYFYTFYDTGQSQAETDWARLR